MKRIDQEIVNILKRLNDKGYEAYVVGGASRDLLLGKDITDIDINTNASNNVIKLLFSDYPLYDIGKELGTITLVIKNYTVDITPYRKENDYINHRRPSSVSYTNDLYEDLSRRDFTINALCIDANQEIIDYFDGISDLNNKTIKAIGNPINRFNEDALRILRAIRFKALLDFEIEENTEKAIFELKDSLKYISSERKRDELLKTLSAKKVFNVLDKYNDIFKIFINFDNLNKKVDDFNSAIYRLAYLLNDGSILKELKFSKHEIQLINTLIYVKSISIEDDYNFIKCLSDENYTKEILEFINQLYSFDYTKRYDSLKKYCVDINSLNINGNELKELGYKDKEIRNIEEHLVEKIQSQELLNDNKSIKEYLHKMLY